VSDQQLDAFLAGLKNESGPTSICWHVLIEQGALATYADGGPVLPGVVAEVIGDHGPGHSVFHFNGGEVTFIGHLTVLPAQLATGPCEALDLDANVARKVPYQIASNGRKLMGPLWPKAGMGQCRNNQLVPLNG
jgi:hypothetical protein